MPKFSIISATLELFFPYNFTAPSIAFFHHFTALFYSPHSDSIEAALLHILIPISFPSVITVQAFSISLIASTPSSHSMTPKRRRQRDSIALLIHYLLTTDPFSAHLLANSSSLSSALSLQDYSQLMPS